MKMKDTGNFLQQSEQAHKNMVRDVVLLHSANEGDDIREGCMVLAEGLFIGVVTAMVSTDVRVKLVGKNEEEVFHIEDVEKLKVTIEM